MLENRVNGVFVCFVFNNLSLSVFLFVHMYLDGMVSNEEKEEKRKARLFQQVYGTGGMDGFIQHNIVWDIWLASLGQAPVLYFVLFYLFLCIFFSFCSRSGLFVHLFFLSFA
jgi:hypothetical protein